jgi:hypothetical protein
VEYVRYGRRVPRLPTSVDFDSVPLVQSVVATLALVCELRSPLVTQSLTPLFRRFSTDCPYSAAATVTRFGTSILSGIMLSQGVYAA